MGASQRVSRGFHRLALVLAILGFLAVAALTAHIAFDLAEQRQRALDEQLELTCAKRELLADIVQAKSQGGRWVCAIANYLRSVRDGGGGVRGCAHDMEDNKMPTKKVRHRPTQV